MHRNERWKIEFRTKLDFCLKNLKVQFWIFNWCIKECQRNQNIRMILINKLWVYRLGKQLLQRCWNIKNKYYQWSSIKKRNALWQIQIGRCMPPKLCLVLKILKTGQNNRGGGWSVALKHAMFTDRYRYMLGQCFI